ncbi:MAG: PAS domain S-box protein, partial [Deltaproteobacteria bacterium]|nr:PAS domain S-box protein [Deltaproteobacteria bacterium]
MAEKSTYEELEKRIHELERAELERKQAEEKLQLTQFSVDNSTDAVYWMGPDAKFIYANYAAVEALGYSKEELFTMTVHDIDPEFPVDIWPAHWAELKEKKSFVIQTIHQRKDESTFPVEVTLNFIQFGSREINCAIVRNITERKRIEKALRESEEQLKRHLETIDSMGVGVFIVDRDYHIRHMNKTMIKWFGDQTGLNCHQSIAGLDSPCAYCQIKSVINSGKTIKYSPTTPDGRSFDIICSQVRNSDGSISKMEIIRDITKRKKAEEALRQSEERFRTLFEDVPAAIQGYGPDGTIHYWNKASENTYGYKKDEAIGNNLIELIIPPEMRGCVHDAIKRGAETGEMPPPEELLLMRQDGSRVPVFSSHTVLKKGKKEPELYCLDVDMTVQKKLQEQLQQAQKMEAISTLSGGIAHQFNNALSVITGNIGLLEMDFPSDKKIANYAKEMKASARQMTHLAAQLLAYARGGKYQAKAVSFCDFVRETLPLVKHTLGPAINVDTDLPIGILNVKADLTQMQMVLAAVLTNAAEAMEGKGRIRVACRDTIITDETVGDFPGLTPGNYVNLTIVDDGKGMDEETRNRIFEPFFTTKFEGRGLGMAAAYGIVKNHAGWISVDSELGKGTTVKIYLSASESVQTRPADLPVTES